MKIHHLDHFVLMVQDVEATCQFYERVRGMDVVTFGENPKALAFGVNSPPAMRGQKNWVIHYFL